MTVTYGFYNSQNHDRKYNATQFARLFEGIINDGVFASIGTSMVVSAATDMNVNVGIGRAWFNLTWTDNDAILPLTVSPSELTLKRIDAVVIEVNTSDDVRANSIKIVKGTPSATPVNPTMINTATIHQHPLAYIAVDAGVTSIIQSKITNVVGTAECPFITGILQTMTIEGITSLLESEFTTWFEGVKGQLSGDVAGNLQVDIDATKTKYATCSTASATAAKVATQTEFSLVAGVIVAVMFTNINSVSSPTLAINGTAPKAIYCNGVAAGPNQIPKMALFQYDGTYYQLLNETTSAATMVISSTLQGYYGAVDTVEDALKNSVHKDTVVVLTSGTSWTPPRANMLIDVFVIGGGGQGGIGSGTSKGGGGGGGGYARFVKDFKINSTTPIPITIGAGGTGGSTPGASGGTTIFGDIMARGGGGGAHYSGGSAGSGGAGGGGGSATTTAGAGGSGYGRDGFSGGQSGGIATVYTPLGSFCPINGVLYGGGGGGGNVSTTQNIVGGGAAGGAGGGGAGGLGAAAGAAGTLYGAGGGGGGDSSTSNGAGGAGYQGAIIIGYNS